MHEVIGPSAQRRLCGFELSGMNRERYARSVGCIAGRAHDHGLCLEVIARTVNEPHLDVVGLALELARYELAGAVGAVDANDRWIAEIERGPVDHRDQRTRDYH